MKILQNIWNTKVRGEDIWQNKNRAIWVLGPITFYANNFITKGFTRFVHRDVFIKYERQQEIVMEEKHSFVDSLSYIEGSGKTNGTNLLGYYIMTSRQIKVLQILLLIKILKKSNYDIWLMIKTYFIV